MLFSVYKKVISNHENVPPDIPVVAVTVVNVPVLAVVAPMGALSTVPPTIAGAIVESNLAVVTAPLFILTVVTASVASFVVLL